MVFFTPIYKGRIQDVALRFFWLKRLIKILILLFRMKRGAVYWIGVMIKKTEKSNKLCLQRNKRQRFLA